MTLADLFHRNTPQNKYENLNSTQRTDPSPTYIYVHVIARQTPARPKERTPKPKEQPTNEILSHIDNMCVIVSLRGSELVQFLCLMPLYQATNQATNRISCTRQPTNQPASQSHIIPRVVVLVPHELLGQRNLAQPFAEFSILRLLLDLALHPHVVYDLANKYGTNTIRASRK